MNENAKGYIKLEIRDGGVAVQRELNGVGILEKMALFDAFIDELEVSIESAMAMMITYVSMKRRRGK